MNNFLLFSISDISFFKRKIHFVVDSGFLFNVFHFSCQFVLHFSPTSSLAAHFSKTFAIQVLADIVSPEEIHIFWTRSWAQHKVWRAGADDEKRLMLHF